VTPRWPRDDAKLGRVQALMAERDFDALVVRAPDNVLYLTNFWPMKGYDICVFPREGYPTLVCLEPSAEDAARMAWTDDVRFFAGYDPSDPRPPTPRAVEVARAVVEERGYGRLGLELSLGTQATDRMVGEPTTYTHDFFHAFGANVDDATPLLVEARAIKTEQEIERMQLANEIASAAMEHVRGVIRPGMSEAQVAAVWQEFVHGEGTGWKGKVDLAFPFSLVWSGPGIKTFTATGSRPVVAGQPTLFEIWVCADGYWADYTKNLCVGELEPRYEELLELLLATYGAAVDYLRPGAELAGLDRLVRERLAEGGYPGQPSHPICHGIGARAHEPPYPHQAGGGVIQEGMVFAVEPGIYWEGGGGLRVEDNYLVTATGPEKLGTFPDDFRGLVPLA
jgi:Xaa-Pro dipeptidase